LPPGDDRTRGSRSPARPARRRVHVGVRPGPARRGRPRRSTGRRQRGPRLQDAARRSPRPADSSSPRRSLRGASLRGRTEPARAPSHLRPRSASHGPRKGWTRISLITPVRRWSDGPYVVCRIGT